MVVGEGVAAQYEAVEVEVVDLIALLGSEIADAPAAESLAFYLGAELRHFLGEDFPAVAPHHIESPAAGVEKGLVAARRVRTQLYMRHKAQQAVLPLVAGLAAEEFLPVGQNHPPTLDVDLGAEAFVEKVETYDGVVVAESLHGAVQGAGIVADGEVAQSETGKTDGLNAVFVAVGVLHFYLAQTLTDAEGTVGIEDALTGAGIEVEAVFPAIDGHGQVNLPFLKGDGDGVDKILCREGEVELVAVGLCPCRATPSIHYYYYKKGFSPFHAANIVKRGEKYSYHSKKMAFLALLGLILSRKPKTFAFS